MKSLYYCTLLAIITVLAACEKAGVLTYEAEANVFFPHTSGIDTLGYSFAKDILQTDSVKFVINRMGKVSKTRSYFHLSYDATSTGSKDVDFIMPADTALYFMPDSMARTLWITVKRSAGLREKRRKVELSLVPDENYGINLKPLVTLNDTIWYHKITISIDDILVQPTWWNSYVVYMGTFSRKKIELFADFVKSLVSYKNLVTSGGSYSGILRDQSKLFQAYLKQQAAAGNTIYEENGTVMVMGTSAQ
jgi:hypothetical protein